MIAAGERFSLALKADGTVVAWGDNTYSQTHVPAGLSGVTQIAAGRTHSLAVKRDGTVVAWGDNRYGQTVVPVGLRGVVQVAAGDGYDLVLTDGVGNVYLPLIAR
jgi:alpha-tubulin suppressor-like RCC1 family protein